MSSVCISNCVNGTRDPRVPVRATYVNLYKWPESDAEFIKSVQRVRQGLQGQTRVVDSISCRQMYVRSYTFSRKESVPQKTKKCLGRVKEKVANHGKKKQEEGRIRKCLVFRKVKEFSCGALFRIFHRLLSCGASVDVVDQKDLH
ncbi:hypothetical protein P3X46_004834 [Hevea brasiliensis]|uniref:Uncharacterized protein n=1 Tax=Hevea brasiliensis TaxID=3981 RepID=A0ABQ9MZB6_HEVBR|nr:uncharacterized protein LOC131178531 [Hevea brasiliensis]KAJ9185174.1 hypothetical protein P3X46_004834 [Hevea brasiliensis]